MLDIPGCDRLKIFNCDWLDHPLGAMRDSFSTPSDRTLRSPIGDAYRFIHRSLLEHFAGMGETRGS